MKKTFDDTQLIQGLVILYQQDLLTKLKTSLMAQYDTEIEVQQAMSKNPKYSYSKDHRDVMRNAEILLNNLAKVNNEITNLMLAQVSLEDYFKKALNLEEIIPSKPNDKRK